MLSLHLDASKTHLGYDVYGTHEQLVQVTVYHEVSAVDQRVFKTGPDLKPQLIRNVQEGAKLPKTLAHQNVNLRPRENMIQLNTASPNSHHKFL